MLSKNSSLTDNANIVFLTGRSRSWWRSGSPGCGRGNSEFIPQVMDAVIFCRRRCIYELTSRRVISGGSRSARSDGRAWACRWKGQMDALTWFKGVKKTRVHRDLGAHTKQTDPLKLLLLFFFLLRVPKGREESQVFRVQRESLWVITDY